jgi:uncharacterized membrane protein
MSANRNAQRGVPLLVLALALTVVAGATDVAAFTRLGGVFASVMTGNLTLLGLPPRERLVSSQRIWGSPSPAMSPASRSAAASASGPAAMLSGRRRSR